MERLHIHAHAYNNDDYRNKICELRELCQEYKVPEELLSPDNRENLTSKQLINEMVYGMNNPYLHYKENSNLNRTYVKC